MKRFYSAVILAAGLLGATAASAVPIYGSVDNILGVIDKDGLKAFGNGNSPAVEESWAQSVLDDVFGPAVHTLDYSSDGRKDGPDVGIVYDGSIGVFDLLGTPEFYIVKNGNGYVLVENLADLSIGAVDSADTRLDVLPNNFNFGPTHATFSHATQFGNGGGGTPVPEPASLALIAAGLLGFGASRRRRTRIEQN